MDSIGTVFWVGILPLLFFVIVDSFMGVKAGLIAAVIMALAEAGYTFYAFGELDSVTLSSVILVMVLSGVAFIKKNSVIFKFQPVILSVAFGVVLLVTYWLGHPLLFNLMMKYVDKLPEQLQMQVSSVPFQMLLKLSSHYLGYFFILHGMLVAWAALKLSNWWWIVIRGVGFWLFMFLGIQFSALMMRLNI